METSSCARRCSGCATAIFATVLFRHRALILGAFAVITLFMAWQMSHLQVNTDVRKMVPLQHPYIQNFFEHQADVDLGNDVRIIVEDIEHDDIFNEAYLSALQQITDQLFDLFVTSRNLKAAGDRMIAQGLVPGMNPAAARKPKPRF